MDGGAEREKEILVRYSRKALREKKLKIASKSRELSMPSPDHGFQPPSWSPPSFLGSCAASTSLQSAKHLGRSCLSAAKRYCTHDSKYRYFIVLLADVCIVLHAENNLGVVVCGERRGYKGQLNTRVKLEVILQDASL